MTDIPHTASTWAVALSDALYLLTGREDDDPDPDPLDSADLLRRFHHWQRTQHGQTTLPLTDETR